MTGSIDYEFLRDEIQRIRPGCRLVAVSKGQSADKIRDLYRRGQREFGENYVQELEEKAAQLTDLKDLRWVFIGALQSNKIQRIIRVASEIQTASSDKHLRYIDRLAAGAGKDPFPVFIEVNAGGEASKGGIAAAEVPSLVVSSQSMPGISLQGIMVIPPAEIDDATYVLAGKDPPPMYRDLRLLADATGMGKLSLGMSGDYKTALAAGSDCVRIGRALFQSIRT
jgi:pyridoxal phosphate enzyme (YggS family)